MGGLKPQYAILDLFRKEPASEFSTSEIVKSIEKQAYEKAQEELNSQFADSEKIKNAKRKLAQLHRKVLYHLNELVNEGVLKVSKQGKRGEKYFALDIEEGEEITIDRIRKRSSITISKPQTPAMPIEGYEQEGIVHKLEPATWIERLNSIIIECSMFDNLKALLQFASTCFSNLNDAVALNDFEILFKNFELNHIINFMHKLNTRCKDYGKRVCCIFDITNLENEDDVIKFLQDYHNMKDKNIFLVFDTRVREFQEKTAFFEKIIKTFSGTNSHLYIKNQDLHQAPYLIGRAGPYTFNEKEWKIYKKELQGNLKCLICAQATVMVDAERFFEKEKRDSDSFREFNLKIANALLSTNSMQRKRSEEFFQDIIKMNEPNANHTFIFSKNYVRFWNYGWKRDDFDQRYLIELFKESKEAVDKFSLSEETIYKSCGMPTRFRIAFACAFESFVKDIFSRAKYKRFKISGIKDFYKDDIKKILDVKEKLFGLFDGGDLITFYRVGDLDTGDIVREISFVLNTYKIPFFRWNFGNARETDMSLARFFR